MTLDISPFNEKNDWIKPFDFKRDFDLMDMEPWISPRDSPWAAFNRLSKQMEQLRRQFFNNNNSIISSNINSNSSFNDFNINKNYFEDDTFRVAIDVQGYKPEELTVSLDNNMLTLKGKHEERSSDGTHYVSRQFMRSMTVPNSVELDKIQSKVTFGGRTLQVEAPVKKELKQEVNIREIPIQITYTKPSIEPNKQG